MSKVGVPNNNDTILAYHAGGVKKINRELSISLRSRFDDRNSICETNKNINIKTN